MLYFIMLKHLKVKLHCRLGDATAKYLFRYSLLAYQMAINVGHLLNLQDLYPKIPAWKIFNFVI